MIRWLPLAVVLALGSSLGWSTEKRSGYLDASPETRAMQDDDAANPGFLWVQQGEALWSQRPATSGTPWRSGSVSERPDTAAGDPGGPDRAGSSAAQSCANCHGAAPETMRGVAARYPMFDALLGRPITLARRIEQCRVQRQHAPPFPVESDSLLGLAAYLGVQSRGMPVRVSIDGPARPAFEAGRALFTARMGQFNLSCGQCHDGLAGQRLGGSVIPQGYPSGYPVYRLGWQSVGSLERRIRNCMVGVRAEPFESNSPEMADLQFYLGWRANGLPVETPGVRP